MAKTFKAGDELRDADGTLLLTFVRDYTPVIGGHLPSIRDIFLPNGEAPVAGSSIDPRAFRQLEAALHART